MKNETPSEPTNEQKGDGEDATDSGAGALVPADGIPNLVLYQRARRALKQAYTIDEVRQIENKGAALKAYAVQANDKEFAFWASEITLRAQIKIGHLIEQLRDEKKLIRGGRSERKLTASQIAGIKASKKSYSSQASQLGVSPDAVERAAHDNYKAYPGIPTLRDYGIKSVDGSHYVNVSRIPEKDLNEWFLGCEKRGVIPTQGALLRLAMRFGGRKSHPKTKVQNESAKQRQRLLYAWDSAWPVNRQWFRHHIDQPEQQEQPTDQ